MSETKPPMLRRLTPEDLAAYGPAAWDGTGQFYEWMEPLPPVVVSVLVEDVLPDGRVLCAWRLTPGLLVELSYGEQVEVPPGTVRRIDGRPFEVYGPDGWTLT